MNANNFFFDESLLQELSNNLMDTFDQTNYSACSASTCSASTTSSSNDDESILQFFNFNNQLMSSISCQCEGGFEVNNNTKVSRPRGAPFSIYVNDKLNVTISNQFLIENNLSQSSVTLSLKTFLFEEVSTLDSLEEYTINLNQAKLIDNNQLQITIPIRRDNTSRRKTRKTTAKTIKGEDTAEDLERKRKMRRSLNQEATKKVSYIQVIANQQVLATSQNMWCRSKTRSEMEKKKGRKTTSAPKKNPSTKRKSSDLVPLEIDQQMINTHLKSAKRVKQTPAVEPISMVEEEIPEYMMQAIPQNWQQVCGVATVDGSKQLQTITANNNSESMDDIFALFDNDFMFQEPMPSPSSAIPSIGIDLDKLFPFENFAQEQQQEQPTGGHMMFAKPVCLDDLHFDNFLTEQEIL